jgi:nucleotide-binding universal stress UspA family protein
MFEKVLVPTDFSKHAHEVIQCIGEVPGVKEVELISVLARDPLARVWDPVAEEKEMEKKLIAEKNTISLPGINIKVRAVSVLEGEVASAIQRVAEEEKASLVAMGARGKSLIQSALLGSVSRNVLRYGDTHLLIMRYKILDSGAAEKYCARVFAKVLFPTDLSQPADAALSFLKGMGGIGELVLLSVVSSGETQAEIDANVAKATEKTNAMAQEISKGGMKVTSKVVVGNPVEQIRSVAEKEDVSLIAMSSQGSAAIKRGHIGSTAYDVANSANRPVLILRRSKIVM